MEILTLLAIWVLSVLVFVWDKKKSTKLIESHTLFMGYLIEYLKENHKEDLVEAVRVVKASSDK